MYLGNGENMTDSKILSTISFDRYSRQINAYEIIDYLRAHPRKKFRILDVGGYRGITKLLHKNDKVSILDVFDVLEKDYIRGDGLSMNFEDESFDFVVSFDVLEHIKNKDRNRFISECARVSKYGVVIASPVGTEANIEAEKLLNELHKQLYRQDHIWLKEHHDLGLPEPNQVVSALNEKGLNTIIIGSNDIVLWTLMQGAVFLNARYNKGSNSLDNLNLLYKKIAHADTTEDLTDSYRHIVFGFKNNIFFTKANFYIKNNIKAVSIEEKVELSNQITLHYVNTLNKYIDDYEKLYKLFEEKIKEKDVLLKTVENLNRKIGAEKHSNSKPS